MGLLELHPVPGVFDGELQTAGGGAHLLGRERRARQVPYVLQGPRAVAVRAQQTGGGTVQDPTGLGPRPVHGGQGCPAHPSGVRDDLEERDTGGRPGGDEQHVDARPVQHMLLDPGELPAAPRAPYRLGAERGRIPGTLLGPGQGAHRCAVGESREQPPAGRLVARGEQRPGREDRRAQTRQRAEAPPQLLHQHMDIPGAASHPAVHLGHGERGRAHLGGQRHPGSVTLVARQQRPYGRPQLFLLLRQPHPGCSPRCADVDVRRSVRGPGRPPGCPRPPAAGGPCGSTGTGRVRPCSPRPRAAGGPYAPPRRPPHPP